MNYVANVNYFKRYITNPRALYYYVNKAIRSIDVRKRCFEFIRVFVPKAPVKFSTELEELKAQGIVLWQDCIDSAKVESLRSYLSTKPVFDIRDLSQKPLDLAAVHNDGTMKLKYFPADIAACDEVIRIANDHKILSLVKSYFGCKPTITIMDAWWTKTGIHDTDALFQDDMYHRDVEDFKFIKLFIYLTDVIAENGAHCFVRGSHIAPVLTARGALTDEKVAEHFKAEDRITITGKSGCGFLEDTFGLHRSLPAKLGQRLLFSVTYSLTSLNPQSPKKPVAPNRLDVDPYINRVYLK